METLFKALGEMTRLKIIKLIAEQEFCVCELVAILDMNQPRVSQHLKVLKNAGIAKERKDKQRSFFSLSEEFKDGQLEVFTAFMNAGIRTLPEFSSEVGRIADLDRNETVRECKESAFSDSEAC
ncbi:MAG: winged helix-turn-helix transcriptional regulator [Firmicutes bacterium]|nr:winged helix-turn-helix transcriptional regulator [Bacillota bacterium]